MAMSGFKNFIMRGNLVELAVGFRKPDLHGPPR